MIDKTLNDLHFKAGLWNSKGELSPSTHATNDLCVKEALTAIYEIGLEVIGQDETPSYGGDKLDWQEPQIRNELRASQRKAWAKACGVAEK